MVIDWKQEKTSGQDAELGERVPAAAYVRMSTEHQKYSTDNQLDTIRKYADRNNFTIIQTYADEGKSGLRLIGRDALQNLVSDVENGINQFKSVLVYDVSRWGRFQDPDEAAEIELRCKRNGIKVHYCAEQFENDGSIGSSIIKTVKRAMAGEYSRELSVKVRAGQANLIRLGYRQGGPPGYGLRRMLVDQNGVAKGELQRGEQKSIVTDRVILVPGPEEEVSTVRRIYEMFVRQGILEPAIVEQLNREGIVSDLGRLWSRGTIHQILINEKYVGHNVWGRTSFKLKQVHVKNPDEEWVRAEGAFIPIVPSEIFKTAQQIIEARSDRLTDDEMLQKLTEVLDRNGYLTAIVIDETETCPSSSSFGTRFGGLLRAYALVGFVPDRDYRYLEVNRALRRMYPGLIVEIASGIKAAGGSLSQDPVSDLLWINDEFSAAIVIVRCIQTSSGTLRWKVRLDAPLRPDLTVVVRMGPSNEQIHDYYLLPLLDMQSAALRLFELNGLSLDAYRFDSLVEFFAMSARRALEVA